MRSRVCSRDRPAEMFNVPIFEPRTTGEGEGRRKSHHPPRLDQPGLLSYHRPFPFSTLSTDKTSAQFKDETRVKWIDRAPSWKAAAPTRGAVAAAVATASSPLYGAAPVQLPVIFCCLLDVHGGNEYRRSYPIRKTWRVIKYLTAVKDHFSFYLFTLRYSAAPHALCYSAATNRVRLQNNASIRRIISLCWFLRFCNVHVHLRAG